MSDTVSSTITSKRLSSNYIRSFAALAVILIHSTGTYLHQFDPSAHLDIRWWTANVYCSLVRWATPFFILISGSVFLNPARTESPAQFLRKRVRRVFLPFAFWALVYLIYQYRGSFGGGEFPSAANLFEQIIFGEIYYHLWFIPMIMGMYLLTPTFRIFIQNARRSDIEYFLVLGFSITAIQHLLPGFFVVEYIGWLGYIGFYVLGYYLSAYSLPQPWKKNLYGLALLMPVVTALGTWWLSLRAGKYDEKLFIYFSPNVVLMTMALFTWLKEFDWAAFAARHPRLDAAAHRFAALSFGIYFIHVLVLDILKNGYLGWHITSEVFFNQPVNPFLGALLQWALVALLSVGCIYLLSKIKGASKWLM